MEPTAQYPFLKELLSPFWRRHQKTLSVVIAAIAATGQARSFAIGTTMARHLGTRLDSAVNRFYRLLRNARVDYAVFAACWMNLLAKPRKSKLVISIDWTEWHHDLRLLVAAAVVGKRAIPVYAQGTKKKVRARSQNAYENAFLQALAEALTLAKVHATILCDRGFRRVSWIAKLQQLKLDFVVRLMNDVCVEVEEEVRPLSTIPLETGRTLDLGVVPLRQDGALLVRVIGYFAKGAREPWWVATSIKGHPREALKLYDRRMTVEEQFRDIKGQRFGVKLFWTQFRDPEALARFMMLLAVALLVWLAIGFAAAQKDKSLLLISRRKGPRQSYVTIGIRIASLDTGQRLTARMLTRRLEPPTMRKLGTHGFGGAK